MKKTILALMLVSQGAFAAFTEVGDIQSDGITWDTVTRAVKNWWSDLTGDQPGQPTQAAPVIAKPTSPVAPVPTKTETAQASQPTAPKALPVGGVKEAEQFRSQALFAEKAEGSSLQDLLNAQAQLNQQHVWQQKSAGRKGTSQLPRSKVGVPVFDVKQVRASKKIPRLDIGMEPLISRQDFALPKFHWSLAKASDMKPLPKAQLVSDTEINRVLNIGLQVTHGPRGLQANFKPTGSAVTLEQVQGVKYTVVEPPATTEKPYKPLSEEALKMVAALILFEKGNHCHMIMGLFDQLSHAPETHAEATYHLGACADQLGMNQATFDQLSQLVRAEDKEFGPDALALLAKDLPTIYEKDFYKVLKGVKNLKALLTEKSSDEVYYRYAKGAHKSGDHKTAGASADMVKGEFTDEAAFLSAINSFAINDKHGALVKLQTLWDSLEARKAGDNNIRALTATNLARLYFGQKKYDKALDYYMKVPKDHPLWVQALIEQGWTQLALDDSSGAIGNMYSLHSPYFKAVYQPESFVVRTIGYLNICQYGDAYRTLTQLEKDYRNWLDKTSLYLSTKAQPDQIYATVKTYLKGKSNDDVDGVPFQVWREMARRKDFLNIQVALNDKQDETTRYEGVNEKIKKEKAGIRWRAEQSKKRFDQAKLQFNKAKSNAELAKNMIQINNALKNEKELTIGYRYQLTILEQSREGYLDFQNKAQTKLDQVRQELALGAGNNLLSRAKSMKDEMSRVLENNEFLRYEVFSGSGENIRYQVTGGKVDGTNNRIPANIKPAKMMNWNFDGEFWEDEIGSYRSALHNNCPATQRDQALLEKESEE